MCIGKDAKKRSFFIIRKEKGDFMKTGKKGIELIKQFEGCKLTAYKCPAGVWTIGYGTTGKVDGKPICKGIKITKSKAESLLKEDLATFEKSVSNYVKVSINQNQFDALVSFAYNVGAGALKGSTLLKKLNKKDYKGAAEEFLRWNKAGGKVLAGLTRRREAERKLFLQSTAGQNEPKKDKVTYVSVTANSGLKCRKTASIKGQVLGAFEKERKLQVLEKTNKDWYKVKGICTTGKTITGYCSSQYLK